VRLCRTGHTYPVDFYCVGALLYELLTGLPPFYSQDPNEIYEAVLQEDLSFPVDVPISNECKGLLRGLLNKDPKQRLGIPSNYLGSLYGGKEILVHPWFGKQNSQNFLEKKVKPPVTFNKL
jgi:serum/glucocorticoid-regulated kinase 2